MRVIVVCWVILIMVFASSVRAQISCSQSFVEVSKNTPIAGTQIVNSLRDLKEAEYLHLLSASVAAKNKDPDAALIVFRATGRDLTLSSIYRAARKSDKWDHWLIKAEIDPKQVRQRQALLKDEVIISIIKEMHKREHSLNAKSLENEVETGVQEIIFRITGVKGKGAQWLYKQATRRYSWDEWLEKSGIDAISIRKIMAEEVLTRDEAIQILQELYLTVDLNVAAASLNQSAHSRAVIERISGVPRDLSWLYQRLVRQKTWDEWIELAGLEVHKVRAHLKKDTFSSDQIIKVLQKLNEAKVDLFVQSVELNHSMKARLIIEDVLGVSKDLAWFYGHVSARKPWYDWIDEAGLSSRSIRRIIPLNTLSRQEILRALKLIKTRKFALNASAMIKNKDPKLDEIIFQATNIPKGAYWFYNHISAIKPWYLWLSDAGFDVTLIQLRGKIPYNLMNAVTQASLREAETYRSLMLGERGAEQERAIQVDVRTSEDAMIEKEALDAFSSFKKSLDLSESELLELVIQRIEEGADISHMISRGVEWGDHYFSPADVAQLFSKISSNPGLLEHFTQQ